MNDTTHVIPISPDAVHFIVTRINDQSFRIAQTLMSGKCACHDVPFEDWEACEQQIMRAGPGFQGYLNPLFPDALCFKLRGLSC